MRVEDLLILFSRSKMRFPTWHYRRAGYFFCVIITADPQIAWICEAALRLNRCIDCGYSDRIRKDVNLQCLSVLQIHKGFYYGQNICRDVCFNTYKRNIINEINWALMSELGRVQTLSSIS